MTPLDIFVLLLLGGGALVGFARGFAQEVLALMAWIAGIAAVKLFHDSLQAKLLAVAGSDASASMLAFALLFLPTFVALRLFGRAVGNRARRSVLGPVDRVLGGGFGMVKGLIGAILVFLIANYATDIVYGPNARRPAWMTRSRTFPLLNASSRAVVDWVETRRHRGVSP
ncbi:MAG: CvpA family protein [Sphingomicrobium sp.]